MDRKFYDIIIVGTGPAGSTAAYLLSRGGFNVLLLDKKRFPREKLCGGLITFKTLRILKEIYQIDENQLVEAGLINNKCHKFTININGYNMTKEMIFPFYLVDRTKYDYYFLKLAEKQGTNIRLGEKVVKIGPNKKHVTTPKNKYFARYLIIGADGINSILRKSFYEKNSDMEKLWKKNIAIAFELSLEKRKDTIQIKHPVVYLGYVTYGYCWAFPHDKAVLIGIGGLIRKNKHIGNTFSTFLKHNFNLKLSDYQLKGHMLPYGNFIEKPVFKNIFLIGDAAGYVDPLTGEGIFYAHKSAQILASTIRSTLADGKLPNAYIRNTNKYILKKMKKMKKIRNTLQFLPPFFSKLLFLFLHKYIVRIAHGIE